MSIAAVLVGINTYKSAPLKGCVNDVIITRDILTKKYNVPTVDIRMLLDDRATKKEILARLDQLVNIKADTKLFWYSGHGAQVPNRNGDTEIDGMDEIICPYDFNWNGNWIADDDFVTIFGKNTNGKIVGVFDSCHSGTINKDIFGLPEVIDENPSIPRRMVPPLDILSRSEDITLTEQTFNSGSLEQLFSDSGVFVNPEQPNIKVNKIISNLTENNIFITGCQENQTSADAYIGGRYQGALSYCLQQQLIKNANITYQDLFTATTKSLYDRRYEQVPNLIGTNTKIPFLK